MRRSCINLLFKKDLSVLANGQSLRAFSSEPITATLFPGDGEFRERRGRDTPSAGFPTYFSLPSFNHILTTYLPPPSKLTTHFHLSRHWTWNCCQCTIHLRRSQSPNHLGHPTCWKGGWSPHQQLRNQRKSRLCPKKPHRLERPNDHSNW